MEKVSKTKPGPLSSLRYTVVVSIFFINYTVIYSIVAWRLISLHEETCHQLLLSGETQYQSKPELLPG